jgi:hypothetical protein
MDVLTKCKPCANLFTMNDKNAYRKQYNFRFSQGDRAKSIEVTFPYEVVDKEARNHNLTIREFIAQYHAIAQFNGFEGVMYTFEKKVS